MRCRSPRRGRSLRRRGWRLPAHQTGAPQLACAKAPTRPLLLFGGGDLGAVRVKTGLRTQQCGRMLEVFLPEQRLHIDVERLILHGELVYGLVVRSMVV